MKNAVAIVGGGDLSDSFLPHIRKYAFVIGVDYGAYWLLSHGIKPHVAIGDFDSVNKKELDEITKRVPTVINYPVAKDATDMELAIDYAHTLSPTDIVLYGAVGSRLDHSLGNLLLLERKQKERCLLKLRTETSEAFVAHDTTVLKKSSFGYISLLSLTEKTTISLTGFVYNVQNKTVYRGQTIGISNELKAKEGKITVHCGKVLVIQSND